MKAEAYDIQSAEQTSATSDAASTSQRLSRVVVVRDALGNRGFGSFLQAQLTVGRADDPLEREADDVAEQIMRTPEPGDPPPAITAIASAPHPVRREIDDEIETEESVSEDEEPGTDVANIGDAGSELQRKCAACEQEEEEEKEEDQRERLQPKRQSGVEPSAVPSHVAARVGSLRGFGDPLSPPLRAWFEPRFGRDFAGVRTHTGAVADQTSRAIGARAYTFGSDIAFRAGAFQPESDAGRRLLAHELTHVVQQAGGRTALTLQRKGPRKRARSSTVSVFFSVSLTTPLSSDQLLLEFAKQYHQLPSDAAAAAMIAERGWHWVGKPLVATAADAKKGYIILHVADHAAAGRDVASRRETRQYVEKLPADEQARLHAAVDRRFWKTSNYKVGQPLGTSPDDRKMAQQWLDIRDELVEQHRQIDELPPRIKNFLFTAGAPPLDPDHFADALRVAKRLEGLTDAQLADYKSKVTAETTDWTVFERSVVSYEAELKAREASQWEREKIKLKLAGLEDLYRTYRDWLSLKASAMLVPSRDEFGVADPNATFIRQARDEKKATLDRNLPRFGFNTIAEFEKAIADYEAAFQKESVAIAFDLLAQYEHVLYEQEKRYSDPASVAALYQALSATPAKTKYEEAAGARSLAAAIRPDPELHRYLPGELQMKREYQEKAASASAAAESAFAGATADHPLLQHRDFDRERLARAGQNEFQSILLGYIRDRREDVRKTRGNLVEHPEMVFRLDELLKVSYQVQQIAPDSIYDLIIRDRIHDTSVREAILKIAIGVIALALGLVSFGTGTVAVLAAVGAFGISAYQAIEEYREYEIKSAAYGAQLLSDDPSFAWVIVAVVAAGIDLAAAASAIRAMKPAVEAFNASGDLAKLEKDLKALAEVNEQLRLNTLKAARAELQYRQAVKGLLATTGRLNAILLPVEEFGKLVGVAYYLAKRGVIAFEKFLLELKAQKLIGELKDLSPEELAILKRAFEEGVEKSRTGLLKYEELSEQIRNVYKPAEVEDIAAHGKLLGYSDKEISDFLEVGSIAKPAKKPPRVPLTADQVKQQMTNWAGVVKPRGYPYLFESLERFEEFKNAVRGLVKKYGLPEGELVIQGSALRTPAAKDVDIALFLSDAEFAKYAEQCRAGLLRRVGEKARASLLEQLDKQIADGYISKLFIDRPFAPTTFGQDARTALEVPFKIETDISVMKASSKVALSPALKL